MKDTIKQVVKKVIKKVPLADKVFQQKGFNKPEGFKGGTK